MFSKKKREDVRRREGVLLSHGKCNKCMHVCEYTLCITSYQLPVTALVQYPADETSISTGTLWCTDEHDPFLYYPDILPDKVFGDCQLSSEQRSRTCAIRLQA